MRLPAFLILALVPISAVPQSQSLRQGNYSMEIQVERLEGEKWKTVDPALVFAADDRIRLHFHTNFDGYVYVTDRSTSGKYEQLFPMLETGQNNRVARNTEYTIPATDTVFRVAGPPGHDILYLLMSPVNLGGASQYKPLPDPPAPDQALPADMTPRCDGEIFRVRGECVDSSAGPQGVAPGDKLPPHLADTARPRDLLFMRKQNSTVVASASPLSGPIVYQFRLAHR